MCSGWGLVDYGIKEQKMECEADQRGWSIMRGMRGMREIRRMRGIRRMSEEESDYWEGCE
jgi:hypothetical protein